MQIIKILQNKRNIYSGIIIISLLFAILTFAFNIQWNRTNDPTNYVGNADGTDWKGYQASNLTINFDDLTNNKKTCRIAEFNEYYAANELIIPSLIQNPTNKLIYELVEIGSAAFEDNILLTGTITLPSSLKTIGSFAFKACTLLVGELIIPNGVTTIGTEAFSGCIGFTGDVIIPRGVNTIGVDILKYCNGLTGKLVLSNTITSITESFRYTSLTSVIFLGQNLHSSLFSGMAVFGGSNISQFVFDGWNSPPNWNTQNAFAYLSVNDGIVRSINGNLLAGTALDILKNLGLSNGWTAA